MDINKQEESKMLFCFICKIPCNYNEIFDTLCICFDCETQFNNCLCIRCYRSLQKYCNTCIEKRKRLGRDPKILKLDKDLSKTLIKDLYSKDPKESK